MVSKFCRNLTRNDAYFVFMKHNEYGCAIMYRTRQNFCRNGIYCLPKNECKEETAEKNDFSRKFFINESYYLLQQYGVTMTASYSSAVVGKEVIMVYLLIFCYVCMAMHILSITAVFSMHFFTSKLKS